MKHFGVCALLVLLALPAAALEPYLVKDINPVPGPGSSHPLYFANFKDAVLFTADDGVHGFEIWRSDGTEAGTWLVADICGSDCAGAPVPFASTEDHLFILESEGRALWVTGGDPASTFLLTEAKVGIAEPLWVPSQGLLYFTAEDADHGEELWRSDGTAAGTYRLADVRPGPEDSFTTSLVEMGGKVYFSGWGELWRTDGTVGGTARVKATWGADDLTVFGNRILFTAASAAHGYELWRSDGTAKGTVMIANLSPGKASTRFDDFLVVGRRVFFVAEASAAGHQLWVTDGTPAGTRALTRSAGVTSVLYPLVPAVIGGRLLFAANHPKTGLELWSTDGTPKGTGLLREVCPGTCSGVEGRMFTFHLGRLFFSGITPELGTEPWVSDGTAAGTRLVRDVCPGSCGSWPGYETSFNGWVLFLAMDEEERHQIWRTDGTEAGTVQVSDFEDLDYGWFFPDPVSGVLLFPGADPEHGVELWQTDGTPEGTRLLKDIHGIDHGGSGIELVGAAGGQAFFYAQDGEHGYELWKSNGTEAGTALVSEQIPGEEPTSPPSAPDQDSAAAAGNRLFFIRLPDLWVSDGTEAGTVRLTAPDRRVCCRSELAVVNGQAFYLGDDGEPFLDEGLWASDGTVAGTRLVKELDGQSSGFTAFQGQLYFVNRSFESELWRSDGTPAGTGPFNPQGLSDVGIPVVHGGRLWFFADDGVHGRELWSTDGTAAGTRLELDVLPGPDSMTVTGMVFVGTKLFFVVPLHSAGEGVWVSDFTAEGTRRLAPAAGSTLNWTVFQGRLYFEAPEDGAIVLWASDGTEAGTAPVLGASGQTIREPSDLEVVGDRLVFTAAGAVYSTYVLWETDGTAAGTVPIRDKVDRTLLKAGDRVFFSAHDPETGNELWAIQ